MAPQTGTALLILVAFVLPGFVALAIRERGGQIASGTTPLDRLLIALYYSTLTYALVVAAAALLGWTKEDLVDIYQGRASLATLVAVGVAVTLVVPAAIADGGRRWQDSALRHVLHEAVGLSREPEPTFVRITTKDGRVLGGILGSADSEGTFVSERWMLDEDYWFREPVAHSLGVWIPSNNVASVDHYLAPTEPLRSQVEPAGASPTQT